LLEVRQTRGAANELLAKYTYNTKYLPLTSTNASGLVTTYTYNTAGQLLTVKNPKNETTTLTYNVNGYLTSVAGPVAGSSTTFTYDGYGRIRTITDPDGYVVRTDYDVLDRPTVVTFPDNTYEQFVYDRLDAVHYRDRLGRWSHNVYDSLRRQNVAIDALGRLTQYIWCSCGSLSEIIDPLKNITSFTRDLQGRVVTKTYNTGKSISYTYENTTSRLKQMTDAKGQKKMYNYYIDNNLKNVSYLNASVATRGVSYTYDTSYNRVKTMNDAVGTTAYSYKSIGSGPGSGRLGSIDGPLANDLIAYNYDSIGRVTNRSINGVVASVVYDKLNRIVSETNALGTFGYSFVNQGARVARMTYPNGQSVVYDYFNNAGDQHAKQIWNRNSSGTTLSKFGYEYTKVGQISKWTQQADSTDISYDELTYDLADELIAATKKNLALGNVIKRYAYQYDQAGNRTNEQIDNTVTSANFNSLNQLATQQNGGSVRVKGLLNELSTVKVKNLTSNDSIQATVDSVAKTFEGFVRITPGGTNILQITATDFSGNGNTKVLNDTIVTGNVINNASVVDLNGNTVSSSNPAVTYGWDAENRLVKINKGNAITEFVYDGLGRRVGEKLNGNFIKRWLWCGTELCEERDGSGGTVTKRFFENGEQIAGVNYYFTKDHLGSIREMTNSSGVVLARYSYDPYGRRTKLSGALDADFGFTGHYYHASSGLNLAMYRAYDASIGRWLSRDPAQENADINLYRYVGNNPIGYTDPTGLWTFGFGGTASGGLGGGGTIALGLYIGHNSNAGFFSGWSIDLQGTLGGGAFLGGGGSAGGFVAVTDADCTGQLKGTSVSLGASGGEGISAGGDIVTGLDDNGRPTYGGVTLNAGVGGGLPVEAHGFGTYTWGVSDLFR
jgi:RHS repeat-associated protein